MHQRRRVRFHRSRRFPSPSPCGPRATAARPSRDGVRRAAPRWLAAVALAALLAGCAGDTRADPPHLLLIVLDALHAKHLSCHGYPRPTTPRIDRLAAEGVRFEQAFASAPYTLASIPSLLTGSEPYQHNLVDKQAVLPDEEVTLAEHLGAHGFSTFGLTTNLNGSELFGLDAGFQHFENLLVGPSGQLPAREQDYRIVKANVCVDRCLDWIDGGALDNGPAFLYLHILEPHTPYTPPEPYFSRFLPEGYDGPLASGETRPLLDARHGKLALDDSDRAAAQALYDANLAYADAQVGRLLDGLAARGVLENFLIQLVSDHGEAFWQHGIWGHNDQLYDEMLHVPWIVRFPGGARAGTLVPHPVALIDLVPNTCRWLGLEAPERPLHGLLVPLEGLPGSTRQEFEARELYLRTNDRLPDLGTRSAYEKAIASRSKKLGPLDRFERFDLAADPSELRDLSAALAVAERQARIASLERLFLQGIQTRVDRGVPLNRAQERLLQELGYVDR